MMNSIKSWGLIVAVTTFCGALTAQVQNGNDSEGLGDTEPVVEEIVEDNPELYNKGCIVGDCANGYGTFVDEKGRKYEGNFSNWKRDGSGVMTFPSNGHYQGFWSNDKPHGMGVRYYANGHTESGVWENGEFQGKQNVWIVVVGVGDYPNFSSLEYTVNDAQSIYGFYRSPDGGAVPEDHIIKLIDEEATEKSIKNAIYELFVDNERVTENDLIVFYFSGHGEEGVFLPHDYNGETKENALSHYDIMGAMKDSEAKGKLIVADACHSGSYSVSYEDYADNGYTFPDAFSKTRSTVSSRQRIKTFYTKMAESEPGVVIMTSSAPEEISLEITQLEHGVFTHFFMIGLAGHADKEDEHGIKDGVVTAEELFDFIERNVQKKTYYFQNPGLLGIPDDKEVDVKDFYKSFPLGISSLGQ